jgi:hypothetical protein
VRREWGGGPSGSPRNSSQGPRRGDGPALQGTALPCSGSDDGCIKLVVVSHPPARSDIACRNCDTPAPLNFCPVCGQETALHAPTLSEFVHEFVGHYVALEGALWRTLRLLLLHPGRLTREYLAGRRRRYVLPLRLYLTASFIFFLVLKLLPSTAVEVAIANAERGAPSSGVQAEAAPTAASRPGSVQRAPVVEAARPVDCGSAGEPPCNALERAVNRVGERFRGDPRGFLEAVRSRLVSVAPFAVFLLLPVYAAIVMLAYRRRQMTYGEHIVFSFHLHAFWFLALLAMAALPDAAGDVVLVVMALYGVWALRVVYRGGWVATVLRALFIGIAYGSVLLIASAVLLLGLLAMA